MNLTWSVFSPKERSVEVQSDDIYFWLNQTVVLALKDGRFRSMDNESN